MRRTIYLTSIDPARNRFRFYRMAMRVDLFGGRLIKEWGRIGRRGRKKVETFKQYPLAFHEWDRTLRKRYRHGYTESAAR